MGITNTHIIRTRTPDPWWNLAVEEYLLNSVKDGECILYLWQNQNTVVIGKNQNAWRECRTELLESEGGKLARRLSGGGAVFHDDGNLNFTFVVSREDYDIKRQSKVILAAVKSLGIDAILSGRNDITANGRKFSGNAFCFRKSGAYHHGTILVSVDFSKLSRYLQVSKEKISSKGIQSVQSRVVNLTEFKPSLTVDIMADALAAAFAELYGGRPTVTEGLGDIDLKVIEGLREKYASWEWRYGETPKFDVRLDTRFPWGGIEIGLSLEKGRIAHAKVFSDAMDEEFIGSLPPIMEGHTLNLPSLADGIRKMNTTAERRQMAEDIALWLELRQFE